MKISYANQSLFRKIRFWLSRILIKSSGQDKAIHLLLKNIPLFDHLNEEQLIELTNSIEPVNYKSGEIVINQGDVGDKFYLIKEGSVRIYTTNPQNNTEIVLARLEAGDYFGEQALLEEIPGKRMASAKALNDTTLYTIPHAAYIKILNPKLKALLQDLGKKELFEMLDKKLEAFSLIKMDVLKRFSGKTLKYSDGEIIFKIQDQPDNAYFIISGNVEIKFPDEEGALRSTELGAGELFGELGVLDQTKRAGTAIAKGELTVLSFDKDAFKKLYEASPELQKLVTALKTVYRIKHRGRINLYQGTFLNLKAIFAVYNLENERSITTAKVIDMPVFSMSYNNIKEGIVPVHYARGAELRRKLIISNHKILSVMSLGEWNEIGEICDLILNSKDITDAQIELFKSTGELGLKKLKIVSPEERQETLCFCMNVAKGQVYDAISNGTNQLKAITEKTGAGSVCGTCRPKIVELLGLRAWTTIKLIQKIPLGQNICSFRFKPVESLKFNYKPGQHIVIQALIKDQLINRSYTLTSVANQDDLIELTVKREEKGYFSNWLFDHAAESSLIRVSDPAGVFTLGEQKEIPVVCFVGGIGVTPAMAFARYISFNNLNYRLHIDYSVKTKGDFILLDEWKSLTSNRNNITINFRATREQGRLQSDHIKKIVEEFPNGEFYICGPKIFEQFVSTNLMEKVAASKVKSEEFADAGGPV